MTSYEDILLRWPRKAGRPKHYADLLAHPLADDPTQGSASYPGWESDHITKPRFYVGGLRWFRNNVGLNPNSLSDFRKDGLERLEKLSAEGKINWRYVDGCQDNPQVYWGDVARVQFNKAGSEKSVFFTKAMIMLMTCEVAVERLLKSGKRLPNVSPHKVETAQDIYARMFIIPAGWRVNNFNQLLLDETLAANPQFLAELARACGHTDGETQFLIDLANGSTVQFSTAARVSDHCAKSGIDLGDNPVRATPGAYGGRGEASRHEKVHCG